MKKLILLTLALSMFLTACESSVQQSEAQANSSNAVSITSSAETPSSNSSKEASSALSQANSTASSKEASSALSQANSTEYKIEFNQPLDGVFTAKELDSYTPSEELNWQEDPYKNGRAADWEHLEYRLFGDYSTYNTWRCGGSNNVILKLPAICYYDGQIDYDAGFQSTQGLPVGFIKMGDGDLYHPTYNNLEEVDPAEVFVNYEEIKTEITETEENVPYGYYYTTRFKRYIQPLGKNNLIWYFIEIENGKTFPIVNASFFVSANATAEDLKLYDAIANSFELVD